MPILIMTHIYSNHFIWVRLHAFDVTESVIETTPIQPASSTTNSSVFLVIKLGQTEYKNLSHNHRYLETLSLQTIRRTAKKMCGYGHIY